MKQIVGKREDKEAHLLEPGEYGKHTDGLWYAACPVPKGKDGFTVLAILSKHSVNEHEDGTITVCPSILVSQKGKSLYHGHLRNGIWEEC